MSALILDESSAVLIPIPQYPIYSALIALLGGTGVSKEVYSSWNCVHLLSYVFVSHCIDGIVLRYVLDWLLLGWRSGMEYTSDWAGTGLQRGNRQGTERRQPHNMFLSPSTFFSYLTPSLTITIEPKLTNLHVWKHAPWDRFVEWWSLILVTLLDKCWTMMIRRT